MRAGMMTGLVAGFLLLPRCTPTDGRVCEQAAEHVKECLGESLDTSSCEDGKASELLSMSCAELKDKGKADWRDTLCKTFGIGCPSCEDLGGLCLSSPLDPTFAPACEADFQTKTLDAKCPAMNQKCCGRPASCAPGTGGCLRGVGQQQVPQSTTAAFTDPQRIYFSKKSKELRRVQLDGTQEAVVLASDHGMVDLSDDASIFALEDTDTNLYVGLVSGGIGSPAVSKVEALESAARQYGQQCAQQGSRCGVSSVAVSPDGKKIAFNLHANFGLPQADWVDTDSVFVTDARTRQLERVYLGKIVADKTGPGMLYFSKDSRSVILRRTGGDHAYQRIDLTCNPDPVRAWDCRGAAQKDSPKDLRPLPFYADTTCAATGAALACSDSHEDCNDGIWIKEPGKPSRQVVKIVDRTPVWGDVPTTKAVLRMLFSRSCRSVIFAFADSLWAVDLATNTVGRIGAGGGPFILPTP
jgi:hypothetical protein